MRNGSVSGSETEATATIASILATAGRMNMFRRGNISSTRPRPWASRLTLTRSPTSGEEPSRRKRPRALHSTVPSPVCT